MTEGLTLHVNDWDDEGTLYHVTGRGPTVASYCILTVRATLLARLTADERDELGAFTGPEQIVTRVIAGAAHAAPRDPDWREAA